MEKATLNFESFELPFFNETKDKLHHVFSDDDIEEQEDNDLVKENMESRIPKSAIYLESTGEKSNLFKEFEALVAGLEF